MGIKTIFRNDIYLHLNSRKIPYRNLTLRYNNNNNNNNNNNIY